jgi:hypothetical protein
VQDFPGTSSYPQLFVWKKGEPVVVISLMKSIPLPVLVSVTVRGLLHQQMGWLVNLHTNCKASGPLRRTIALRVGFGTFLRFALGSRTTPETRPFPRRVAVQEVATL